MSPSAKRGLLTVISLVLFFSTTIAESNQATSGGTSIADTTSDNALAAQSGSPNLPEDTSRRFQVREVRISGNSLLSTDELLEELPEFYTVTKQKDDAILEEVYDFRALRDIVHAPGEAREVSQRTIQGFTEYLLSVHRKEGYAGIYVYVPAKAVDGKAQLQDGILQISIIEGKVETISIRRYDFDRQEQEGGFLRSSAIRSWSPVKEGQVIRQNKVDEFIKLLNLNPDRYMSPVVTRSDKPDALDLRYDVYEANPWHWYIQSDNAGTKDRQWSPRVGVVNTNFTGIDDRLVVMYQAKPEDVGENYALFFNYERPVFSPRLRLGVYAGYTEYDITSGTGAGINFVGNGWFCGGTLRYSMFQKKNWLFDLLGSVSHEESKVTPSLGINSDAETNLYGVGAEIHRASDMSSTSLSFIMQNSFGGSSNSEFQIARTNSDPDFTIYTASLLHKQFMDEDKIHELSGSFRGIFPDERLIPAKMTPFGGLYTVRGYEEDRIVADGGIIASLQYRFDLTKHNNASFGPEGGQPGSNRKKEIWPPNVSLLAFSDYGKANTKDRVAGEESSQELWGAGVGTLLEAGDEFDAAIYYAWPFLSVDGTSSGDGRFNFSLIYRW